MPVRVWLRERAGNGDDLAGREIVIPNGVYLEHADDKLLVLGGGKDVVVIFSLANIAGAAYFDGVEEIREDFPRLAEEG